MTNKIRNFFQKLRKNKQVHATSSTGFTRQQILSKIVTLLKHNNLDQVVNAKTDQESRNLEVKYSHEASLILKKLYDLGFTKNEIGQIVEYSNDIEQIRDILRYMPKAGVLKLTHFTNGEIVTAVTKKWRVRTLFEIAKKIDQHSLEEDSFNIDFQQLLKSNISDKEAMAIVDMMVECKYKDIEIKQKDILRYLNSISDDIEDPIRNLYLGLYISKEKDLKLTVNDFIRAASYDRPPKAVAATYAKIKENDIAINKDRYLTLYLSQNIIDKIVNYIIIAKKYDAILDFDDVIKLYSLGYKIFDILHILIKLRENDIKEVSFNDIIKLSRLGSDIETLLPALLYIKNTNLEIKDFLKYSEQILPLKKEGDQDPEAFNLLNFAKAINTGEAEFGIDIKTLINDFAAGVKVWEIIDLMKYARTHGQDINYIVAKILARSGIDNLKEVVYKTLSPFEIEGQDIYVTTKDNIDIKIKFTLLVTYNINNFFKGTDEEYLLRRIKAILIDEIQKRYNHDEIVKNIEVISRNVILRLKGQQPIYENDEIRKVDEEKLEEPVNEAKFMEVSKFVPVKLLIPQIDFEKATFKELEKLKHEYEAEKEKIRLELDKLKAEVKIREAWAKSKDLKYLILKDEDVFRESKHFHQDKDEEEDLPGERH